MLDQFRPDRLYACGGTGMQRPNQQKGNNQYDKVPPHASTSEAEPGMRTDLISLLFPFG